MADQFGREILYTDKVAKPFGAFSQAVVWHGTSEDIIFLSGMGPLGADGKVVGTGDIRAQTVQCLENMKNALAAAGATLEDVTQVTVYVSGMEGLKEVHEVRRQYWPNGNYPASALLMVKGFVDDGFLIEIESTAVVAKKK